MSATDRLLNSIFNPPDPLSDGAYSGYYYAFYGDGGFSTDQSFNQILLSPEASASFQLYDVTYAVQVKFDVRKINEKIGLIKDASNLTVIDSSYDFHRDSFPIDSITIDSGEFINGMSAEQVISVGAYQTMYREYMQSVNKYFFNTATISDTLLSQSSTNDLSNGLFDADAFMSLINQQTDSSHPYVHPLLGFVTLSNINQLLRYAVDNNVFGNRVLLNNDTSANTFDLSFTNSTVTDIYNNTVTTTVIDPVENNITITIQDNSNNVTTTIVDDIVNHTSTITTTGQSYSSITTSGPFTNVITPTYADVSFSQTPANHGVTQGFLAGDLIFIPAGTTVALELMVDPMIDASSSSIYDLIVNSGLAYEYAIDLSNIATQKTTMVNKILTAPLLIELANLS
jgi:hypothetical protein